MTKSKKVKWAAFPQKDFEQWFADYVFAKLAMEFHHKNGKWPKKINLSTIIVNEDELTVDLK